MTAARSMNALPDLIGESPQLLRAVAMADRYADTALSVLIVGETGTGKELVAHRIHRRSRRSGRMVDLNCGSLRPELADSLLFGHRRGAFTGAVEATQGLIAQADRGTLFLDELTSLHPVAQASLLRVLEDGALRRVGDVEKRSVDFRLIAAVQEDIGRALERGEFRRDLFHRLAAVTIELPPLRDRLEDLLPLSAHFARLVGVTISGSGIRRLSACKWTGNIRELRSVIARAAVGREGAELDVDDIEEALAAALKSTSGPDSSADAEAQHLLACLKEAGWNVGRAASRAGLGRSTMYLRMKEHGIKVPRRPFHALEI